MRRFLEPNEGTSLGRGVARISEIGCGGMLMAELYGAGDDAESMCTPHRSVEIGIDVFDPADAYGRATNEVLVGRALAGRRARAVIATKFGIVRDPADPTKRGFDGRPDDVRASLKRRGIETIDWYCQHRVDLNVPIEETAGAAEWKTSGYLGLPEASTATIRRAHAVHAVATLQVEYSSFSRDIEDNGILAAVRELGITAAGYSPLGRGS